MLLRSIVIVLLVDIASSATLSKKNSYGGDPNYGVPSVSSYGSGGVSAGSPPVYDPSAAAAASSIAAQSSYGVSATGNVDSNSYGNSAAASNYGVASGTSSVDAYGSSSGGGATGGNSADSYGNLYYYYYPVTNHTSSGSNAVSSYSNGASGSYGNQGGGNYGNQAPSYGGGGQAPYYPAAPIGGGYGDPLGGLLSVISSVDINSLILPILLIGGVALLLPAILNCDLELGTCVIPLPAGLTPATGTRKSRRAVEYEMQQLSIAEMVQHAYNIYDAAQQSEQCMERVVCEVGGMMSNVRGKDTFFSVMEHFATPYIKKQLRVLKEGAMPSSPRSSLDASLSQQTSTCEKFACGKLQQPMPMTNDNQIGE